MESRVRQLEWKEPELSGGGAIGYPSRAVRRAERKEGFAGEVEGPAFFRPAFRAALLTWSGRLIRVVAMR